MRVKTMQEYIKKEEFEAFQSQVLNQFRDIVELFCKQQAHMERHLECTENTQKHLDAFVARMDHLCQFIQSVSDSVEGKPEERSTTSCH
ncbi:hypothetical protein [Endozoicomonas sp.]|uniref:hypothetical protein n=1 Tax=Endozoicomonas sp. TaxID=1892382 RepID=UPI0028868EBD|nr:hypothetical protein [Endozoicomonas sp.]